MLLGVRGEDLIKSFEKCRLSAYLDSGGVPTIGWGHIAGVRIGQTCTADEADAWFEEDAEVAETAINHSTLVPLTQNQFDALVCFTYNVGISNEAHSTLLRKLNARDYQGAADEFLRWNHVNGQVSDGLSRRRHAERDLFLAA